MYFNILITINKGISQGSKTSLKLKMHRLIIIICRHYREDIFYFSLWDSSICHCVFYSWWVSISHRCFRGHHVQWYWLSESRDFVHRLVLSVSNWRYIIVIHYGGKIDNKHDIKGFYCCCQLASQHYLQVSWELMILIDYMRQFSQLTLLQVGNEFNWH